MKSIQEWIDLLPEPIRGQALNNLSKSNDTKEQKVESLPRAIIKGFIWDNTPEKHRYWHYVHIRLIVLQKEYEKANQLNHK